MRKHVVVLIFTVFFIGFRVNATNYYISEDGNDDNSGKSPKKSWQTIDRLNKEKLRPGDTVFFRANDVFRGSIYLNQSGKRNKPIVISSYGKGNKPVICGTRKVNSFSKKGEHIYVARVPVEVKNVFRNNKRLTKARYPNTGFLTMEGGGHQYLIEGELPFPDYILKGATLRMRTVNWQYETRKILSVSGQRIQFDSILFHNRDTFTCKNGWGYYLDNKKEFLDTQNEWFYDSSGQKLFLFHEGSLPDDFTLETAYIDNGICIAEDESDIHIENLHFSKFNKYGICTLGKNKHITMSDCRFSHTYLSAISGGIQCSDIIIKNNDIQDSYGQGISLIESANCRIESNQLKRIGIVPGIGIDGVNGGTGIVITNREFIKEGSRVVANNNYIGYNIIDSTGYGSIRIDGNNSICEYNVVSYALLTLNDGGMIYCWALDTTFTHHNIIRNNIVKYNIGNTEGTPKDHGINIGIYIDNNAHHIQVENNIVTGTGSGIHINDGSYNNSITGNILYGNKKAISFAEWNWKRLPMVCKDNSCKNNVLFNTLNLHHTLSIQHTYKPEYDPGEIDSNLYASPKEQYHIKKLTVEDGCKHTREYTLQAWQNNSNDDANSSFAEIGPETKSLFLVNEKSTKKEFQLEKNLKYTCLKGHEYTDKIELEPYSAQILLYRFE
jgi:parallel beta-helix repeat protein